MTTQFEHHPNDPSDIEFSLGVRDSVPLAEILASAPGPTLGGIPGLTEEEALAFLEALEI